MALTTPWPYPFWIAHRGAGKLAPENTLAAFRVGAGHGWRAFECDVKLSADDEPFLLHDATLERTTPEAGVAGERTWSVLSCIDAGAWHSRRYAGEPIPHLQAIARFVQANGFALNIEVKPTPGTSNATGRVVAQQVKALWAGQALVPLLSSFQVDALKGARDAAPELPRALLVDTLWDGWHDAATDLGCVAVVANHTLADAAFIRRLHASGLRALVYTVNDPAAAQRLIADGIDGIITDAVDRFSPVG
ncbi:glycerophosphoryl diester phosphodiesterase [Burkholderiales bacterium JOSHI_001]|nr:glycerophosphoryl diester phosphodiesterase [Burkholderiales bacterium JOSHI_001]